jgi:cyclic pyranopterin phosphate synthase
VRGGASDAEIATAIARIWQARTDRYSQLRGSAAPDSAGKRVEMSYIGG